MAYSGNNHRGGRPKKGKPTYVYSEAIANSIQRQVKAGVSIAVIADGLKMPPKTLYKYYGDDIKAARAEIQTMVGEKIVDRALKDGSDKMLELYARSKMGWSPKETIEEGVAPEEDESTTAIDELAALLGIDKVSEENTEENTEDTPEEVTEEKSE